MSPMSHNHPDFSGNIYASIIKDESFQVVRMPSNIALVKYMGKIDSSVNQASNPSYSLTLPELYSEVSLVVSKNLENDQWLPLESSNLLPLNLSQKGQERFLNFFAFLKNLWGLKSNYKVYSGNNFPSDCGIASSSSSFAAITVATYREAQKLDLITSKNALTLNDLALISKRGSGSSCRSFFKDGAIWSGDQVERKEHSLFNNIYHEVCVVNSDLKSVSSSLAHRRVTSSLLFENRDKRVQKRMDILLNSNTDLNWSTAYSTIWSEFWDMHALFETSEPSFYYMTPDSLTVLRQVQNFWENHNDGPLVTMDAGANIHFIWRQDQLGMVSEFKHAVDKVLFIIGKKVGVTE